MYIPKSNQQNWIFKHNLHIVLIELVVSELIRIK